MTPVVLLECCREVGPPWQDDFSTAIPGMTANPQLLRPPDRLTSKSDTCGRLDNCSGGACVIAMSQSHVRLTI